MSVRTPGKWMLALGLLLASLAAAAPLGGDFSLTRADGSPFSLHDARGKVVVLSFGYTSCPDVCPTTLMTVGAMMRELGPAAAEVVPVFISVDPKRDAGKRLHEYVTYFHPAIVALTGSEARLREVAHQYGTTFHYDAGEPGYDVEHSANLYLIDRSGRLARIIPYGVPPSVVLTSVRELLQAPADVPS